MIKSYYVINNKLNTAIKFCLTCNSGLNYVRCVGRPRRHFGSVSSTSFQESIFSACLSRWERDPGCGWSHDHLSIQNRRVGVYSSTFWSRGKTLLPDPSSGFFYHPDSGCSRDQPQPGRLFQRLREAEKRDSPWERGFSFVVIVVPYGN